MLRRLLRWGFHVAAALSFVLGLALGVMQIRSYCARDSVGYLVMDGPSRRITRGTLWSSSGVIACEWDRHTDDTSAVFIEHAHGFVTAGGVRWQWVRESESSRLPSLSRSLAGRLGFHAMARHTGPEFYTFAMSSFNPDYARYARSTFTEDTILVTAPHWFVALLLVTPVIPIALRIRRQRVRRTRGLCLHCGYDLRASRERCPECGTPIGGKSAGSAQ